MLTSLGIFIYNLYEEIIGHLHEGQNTDSVLDVQKVFINSLSNQTTKT